MENVTPYKEQAATKTDEPIDVEFGIDQEDTADNAANTKPDIKQSAITIIAIIIIINITDYLLFKIIIQSSFFPFKNIFCI